MASIYLRGATWWITYRINGRNIAHSLNHEERSHRREDEGVLRGAEDQQPPPRAVQDAHRPIPADPLPALAEGSGSRPARRRISDACGASSGSVATSSNCAPRSPRRLQAELPSMPEVRDENSHRYAPIKYLEQLTAQAMTDRIRDRFLEDEICGKTANKIRGVLSSMFEFAIQHFSYRCPDLQHKNPVEAVPRFKEDTTPPISWLTQEQIEQQLAALQDHPQLRTMVAFYIYSGLRRMEGLWLTRDDVDLKERLIRVRKKTVDGEYWEPKTGKARVVPIGSKLYDILVAYAPTVTGTWFFPHPTGGRWRGDSFSLALRERSMKRRG